MEKKLVDILGVVLIAVIVVAILVVPTSLDLLQVHFDDHFIEIFDRFFCTAGLSCRILMRL